MRKFLLRRLFSETPVLQKSIEIKVPKRNYSRLDLKRQVDPKDCIFEKITEIQDKVSDPLKDPIVYQAELRPGIEPEAILNPLKKKFHDLLFHIKKQDAQSQQVGNSSSGNWKVVVSSIPLNITRDQFAKFINEKTKNVVSFEMFTNSSKYTYGKHPI